MLPFVVAGDPSVVPPVLSYWTPPNLGPYFTSRYDVADPDLIYWYMARLGLTMNDLLTNPNALRWLGRATGTRNFVFGSYIQNGAGFDANTYLIDSEFGYQQNAASITVQDPNELKVRLPELAFLTMMTPADRAAYLAQQVAFNGYLQQGQMFMAQRQYPLAINAFMNALALRPDNVQAQLYLQQAQSAAQMAAWQNARLQQMLAMQAASNAIRLRQLQLAQASTLASQQATASAAAMTPAQLQERANLRIGAQQNMIAQAQTSLQSKQFGVSVNLLQAARSFKQPAGVDPPVKSAAIDQSLAQAKLGAQKTQQALIAPFNATRETAQRQRRDQQLTQAQTQIAAEQKATQAAARPRPAPCKLSATN